MKYPQKLFQNKEKSFWIFPKINMYRIWERYAEF